MKAILTLETKSEDGTRNKRRLLFDTDKSQKVIDVPNDFGNTIATIWLSPGGILFKENKAKKDKLEIMDQEAAKRYIGEHDPEIYIKYFGEVEEA